MGNKPFLMYNPEMAIKLGKRDGDKQAVILERIYYWMRIKCNNPGNYKNSFIDGKIWVFNSISNWHDNDFPHWSERTVENQFKKLRGAGYIDILKKQNKLSIDRTIWYTINFDAMPESMFAQYDGDSIYSLIPDSIFKKSIHDSTLNGESFPNEWEMDSTLNREPLPKQSSLNNPQKNSCVGVQGRVLEKPKHNAAVVPFDFQIVERQFVKACKELEAENVDDVLYVVKKFYQCWFRNFGWSGEPPRRLSQREVEQCVRNMWEYEDDSGCIEYIELWEYDDLIERYFEIDFPDCDYSLTHFLSGKIRQYRMYETAL